jgi:mRNA interferase MazF
VKRGEVWWADLGPPAGRRPVLLLSRDDAYAVRTAVTIAPLTTTIRGIPVEVPLGPEDGLPRPCAANLDSVATIPMRRLQNRLASLSAAKMALVGKAITFALDLDRSIPPKI